MGVKFQFTKNIFDKTPLRLSWVTRFSTTMNFTTSQGDAKVTKEDVTLLYHSRRENPSVHTGSIFIVMRGFPGTGKSTIARLLAAALHASLIDRDIIRQTAVHVLGELPHVGQFSYELMFALAREQLSLGLSVVIDTPLTYRTTYEQCKGLAKAFQTPMLVVHCQCPPEVQKRRLEDRKGNVSAFQITSWDEWERWKPRFEAYEDGGCTIDTSNPMDDSLATVMRSIYELRARQTNYTEQEISN